MDYYRRIQGAVEYIENHLTEEMRIGDIAAAACFSAFHFQRLFRAISGFSVQEYIRKRRLAEAAQMLRGTGHTILEIAVSYQYGSHEAFTRAFSDCYHISPDKYRKEGGIVHGQTKINFLKYKVREGGEAMRIGKPEITHVDPIPIVGVSYTIREGDDPFDACHGFHRDFGEHEYYARIPGRARPAVSYGIAVGDSFIVGEEVTDPDAAIEAGYTRFEIPAGRYALFAVIDSVSGVQDAIKYVYRIWLPNSNYTLRDAPYFEVTDVCGCVYPDRMNMIIYIPIE